MNKQPQEESFRNLRILAALLAAPPTALVCLLVWAALKSDESEPLRTIFGLTFGTAAALCWWFALRGHVASDRMIMLCALIGACLVGGIGFVIGFFGPMIFSPGSNQGPLAGIFLTGPLGFAAGGLLGAVVGFVRTFLRKPQDSGSRIKAEQDNSAPSPR